MKPAVLLLCCRTPNMGRPWADAGYPVLCVDNQHEPGESERDGITTIGADVLGWLPPRTDYSFAAAFPPCTHLAVSGSRWMKDKGLASLAGSLAIVEYCRRILEWTGAPWFLENPVGTLSTYWRKPDYYCEPWEFGGYPGGGDDGYTKKTCLWTGGGFVMPRARPVPLGDNPNRIHDAAPSDDRGDMRSITPPGFARAMFEANAA